MTILNANAVSKFLLNFEKQLLCHSNFFTDDDDSCMDLTVSCNCYSKLRFPLQDTLRITDKDKLPVTGFGYGPFTHPNAQATINFNSLECFGPSGPPADDSIAVNITSMKNGCDPHGTLTMLSSTSLQYYIDYDSHRPNCYVEIAFTRNVALKLTVTNLQVSGIYFWQDSKPVAFVPISQLITY